MDPLKEPLLIPIMVILKLSILTRARFTKARAHQCSKLIEAEACRVPYDKRYFFSGLGFRM